MGKYPFIFALLFLSVVAGEKNVHAQFAGDLFFDEPSVAIAEGGQGTLEVLAFSGSNVFGAGQFSLHFDPEKLEIVSVQPGQFPALNNGFTVHQTAGRVSIVVLNSGSLVEPIGTVSLARLQVRPLVAAGEVVSISTVVAAVLRQDSSAFSAPRGFGAEIVVTVSGAGNLPAIYGRSANNTAPGGIASDSALRQRAMALRRVGSMVTLKVLNENKSAESVTVQTRDPEAARE